MGNYPNIFEYATKEFTQDAMVCWMLESIKGGYDTKDIGIRFLKELVLKGVLLESDIKIVSLNKQLKKIDVYAEVECDGIKYPIIFENKTNTTLHGKQLNTYCSEIYKKFKNDKKVPFIYYVYFKTGFVFHNEKNRVEQELENTNVFCNQRLKLVQIYLDDIICFLDNLDNINDFEILQLYRKYLKKVQSEHKNAIDNCWKLEGLNNYIGQGKFFEQACGENVQFDLVNSGGIHNTCHSINTDDGRNINLVFRFEPRDGNKIVKTYIQYQLYHNKECKKDFFEEEERKAKRICEEICEDTVGNQNASVFKYKENVIIDFASRRKRQANYKGAEIFRIVFITDNEEYKDYVSNAAEFVGKFERKFKLDFILGIPNDKTEN